MSFSTTSQLFPHQEQAVAKLLPSRVGALFMDMGTGKSRTIIELARIRQAKWDRFIWFCPVSLKKTVVHELTVHTDLEPYEIYIFSDKTDDANVPMDAKFYVIGIESMASSDRVVLAANKLITDRSFVIVDESSYIKGHKAARTQRITGISERSKYRAVLTGTPFSQGMEDLYSQMKFLSPTILGYKSFYSFSENHLEYRRVKLSGKRSVATKQIIGSHNTDLIAEKIAPYVYQVQKDECLTLPDKLFKEFRCELTEEQRKHYYEAKQDFLAECDPDSVSPIAIFKLFTALQTITCGSYYGQTIPHNRIEVLQSALASIPDGERVIIWAKYRHAVDEICTALGDQVHRYDGTLSEAERHASLESWRAAGGYLVATQSSGSHGLTLNEASYAVFYANSFKYSERIQAEDRNHRIGQTRRPVYIDITASDCIDEKIKTALNNKGSALLAFKASVDEIKSKGLKGGLLELVRNL